MRLLVIGLDRQVMDPESPSAKRQREYFRDFEADIVVLEPGEPKEVSLGAGLRALRPGGRQGFGFLWAAVRHVRKMVRDGSYDLVTVQDPFLCGLVAVLAGGHLRSRFVVQDHSGAFARRPFGWKERLLRPFAFWLVRSADAVRTVSERGRQGLVRAGVDARRINVISVPAFDIPTQERSPRRHHIVTIARASKEKGLDVLLRAFVNIKAATPDATLTIIGDGPELPALQRLTETLGIGSSVAFAGEKAVGDLSPMLATADVYVQPSRFEGWGMAVCEAAELALPIVMTDVGLAGEVIKSHASGLVVPPDDADALTSAVLHLFRSPEEAKRFGEAARVAVRALPRRETQISNVREAYIECASHPAVVRDPVLRLYVTAFLARAVVLVLILLFAGVEGLFLPDSKGYVGLAQSLLAGNGFAYEGVAYSYRTIGYPLFLAILLPLLRSFALISIVQIAIASLLPIFTQRLGRILGCSRRVRRGAAWLTALEPHMVFYAVPLLTEWIFPLLTILVLVTLFCALQTRRPRDVALSGFWFGLGLLIKPLWLVVPPLVLIGLVVGSLLKRWRPSWRLVGLWCGIVLIMVAPWVVRNRLAFGTWNVSSQGPSAAVFYLGSSITSVAERIPYAEAEALVRERFRERTGFSDRDDGMDRSLLYTSFAKEVIRAHPQAFLRVLLTGTLSFWTSHNYAYVPHYYHLTPPLQYQGLPPTHYLVQGRYGEFFSQFSNIFGQPFYLIGALGRGVWALVGLLMLIGIFFAVWRTKAAPVHLIVLAMFVALTATIWVNGLGVEGRLRMPIMPLQWLYAGMGFAALFSRKTKQKKEGERLSLLFVTQRVDADDRNLAVHVRWLRWFGEQCGQVRVIAQAVGRSTLPTNVDVRSLGKERGATRVRQLFTLWRETFSSIRDVDAVFVLMSPLYVLLLCPIAWWYQKPIYLWYTHKHVSWTLRAAVFCVRHVFSASPESFRLKTLKVVYTGHAIDTDFFHPAEEGHREKGAFVTVGRISRAKRIEFMIDAVELLRAKGASVKLDVIGEPVLEEDREYMDALRSSVMRRGLDWVWFLGGQSPEEVRAAYQHASVCLNASLTGSLDKALLEAMACGCPVVTTNIAFAKIVPEGFVQEDTVEAFSVLLERILSRHASSSSYREHVLKDHQLSNTLSNILKRIVAGAKRDPET